LPRLAVQVIAYEVRMAWLATQENGQKAEPEEAPYPLVDDLERFYGHLEKTLLSTGFIRADHPGQVMNKLRRLFTRARPESQELNILRGACGVFLDGPFADAGRVGVYGRLYRHQSGGVAR
jgi:tRNA (cytidine32/uridine32-2'-O)-methyltransferase